MCEKTTKQVKTKRGFYDVSNSKICRTRKIHGNRIVLKIFIENYLHGI